MDEAPADVVESVARERVGSTLRGKWRLDALIGVGGMAAVYAATHRHGLRGAVKVLHPQLAAHRATRQRFLREGYVANSIEHRGVVRVLDDDVDDVTVFLVMDLLEGEDLESIRLAQPRGRLATGATIAMASQLLDVLSAAHEVGVVHRDLKPDNVFLSTTGVVKVLDFGIARARFAADGQLTESGLTMGTPAYMPPEQAAGERDLIDARTDLWAVGATMFTLLTGEIVHDEPTVQRILAAAMSRPAPPLRLRDPSVPEGLAEVVDRALSFDPDQRYPSAAAMRDALDLVGREHTPWSEARLGELALGATGRGDEHPSAFAATRPIGAGARRPWVALTVLGLVGAAAIGGLLSGGRVGDPPAG
ncbi:MAG: serine/threonine-protein kinase, partial [Polyangiaceae bacterium]